MMTPSEMYLQCEKEEEKQLLEIIDKPTLSPAELWMLTERNFKIWRKKHDYPKLIKSFDENLPRFLEWRNHFEITDEMLMEYSVTDFMSPKPIFVKNRSKFIVEAIQNEIKQCFVALDNHEGKTKDIFNRPVLYKNIKEFVPYSDWVKKDSSYRDFAIHPTRWHSPGCDLEQVWLSTGYEMLKMGGIDVPVNGAGVLLRSKSLEFVNLSEARFKGRIYFGENTALQLNYCFAGNLYFDNVEMSLVSIFRSEIKNIRIIKSEIQQWSIISSTLGGDIIDSKLRDIRFIDGSIYTIFNNSRLDRVSAFKHRNNGDDYIYKALKKVYADQGDDEVAGSYYVAEREVLRSNISNFDIKKWKTKSFWITRITYMRMTLAYHYWRYGKSPHRVIFCSVGIIMLSALFYYIFPNNLKPIDETKTFFDCFYFSTITFTTVGYGDYSPTGFLRVVAAAEAFLGVANFGFLISGYTASKY